MKPVLQPADFSRAAQSLGCSVAAIRAVAEVESDGGGFLKGQILITRFEGHIFRQKTGGKFDQSHPTLSHRYMEDCPYNKGPVSDLRRLELARQLAGDVAFECASYGMFQIMGFHYALLGYKSAYEMVQAFNQSESVQLDAFVKFIRRQGLDDELRELRFADFAYRYNGANYRANRYDIKMLNAYGYYLPNPLTPVRYRLV